MQNKLHRVHMELYRMQSNSGTHQSLERALALLLAFEPKNSEMGTIELSEMSGLHKSTVSRLLKVLTGYEFLQQNPSTKKYSLGPAVIRLSRSLNQSLKTNLVQIARPYIDSLSYRLKETVIMEILAGENMVLAYIAEGPRIVRLAGDVGDRVAFHAAAGAKAFLAFCPPDLQKKLLGTRLRRLTKNTITDFKKLQSQMKEIRKNGFAIDREELDEGTMAVAAPIFNYDKNPIGAIVVAGPPQRISGGQNKVIVTALKITAKEISERFYYTKLTPDTKLVAG
jgi:DNA-binding IclR family transcriptional regulator